MISFERLCILDYQEISEIAGRPTNPAVIDKIKEMCADNDSSMNVFDTVSTAILLAQGE